MCKISIRMFKDFLLLILKSDSNQSNIRLLNNEKEFDRKKAFSLQNFHLVGGNFLILSRRTEFYCCSESKNKIHF